MRFLSYIFRHKNRAGVYLRLLSFCCGIIAYILYSKVRYNEYLPFVALSDSFSIYVCFMIKQMHCKVLGYSVVHSFNST